MNQERWKGLRRKERRCMGEGWSFMWNEVAERAVAGLSRGSELK